MGTYYTGNGATQQGEVIKDNEGAIYLTGLSGQILQELRLLEHSSKTQVEEMICSLQNSEIVLQILW
jgi:hypothetical protein